MRLNVPVLHIWATFMLAKPFVGVFEGAGRPEIHYIATGTQLSLDALLLLGAHKGSVVIHLLTMYKVLNATVCWAMKGMAYGHVDHGQ